MATVVTAEVVDDNVGVMVKPEEVAVVVVGTVLEVLLKLRPPSLLRSELKLSRSAPTAAPAALALVPVLEKVYC